jgi:hypothetical protein
MGENYIEQLARMIYDEVEPSKLPNEETASLFRLYAVLALAKGAAVTREDVHNAWAAWMSAKDPDHESIRPYSELTANVQVQDQPYVVAIHTAIARLDSSRNADEL